MTSSDGARRVLIVDDSTTMRRLLALAVSRVPGVVIEQAEDGVAALKMLAAAPEPYDLVLLDLNMPMMDGMKLLGRIHGDPRLSRSAVCVVTTEESDEAEARARKLGARFYLRKPVNRRRIEEVVAQVFGFAPPP